MVHPSFWTWNSKQAYQPRNANNCHSTMVHSSFLVQLPHKATYHGVISQETVTPGHKSFLSPPPQNRNHWGSPSTHLALGRPGRPNRGSIELVKLVNHLMMSMIARGMIRLPAPNHNFQRKIINENTYDHMLGGLDIGEGMTLSDDLPGQLRYPAVGCFLLFFNSEAIHLGTSPYMDTQVRRPMINLGFEPYKWVA